MRSRLIVPFVAMAPDVSTASAIRFSVGLDRRLGTVLMASTVAVLIASLSVRVTPQQAGTQVGLIAIGASGTFAGVGLMGSGLLWTGSAAFTAALIGPILVARSRRAARGPDSRR